MAHSSVRFTETRGVVAELIVDAPSGQVSLEGLCALLFALRVQVVRAAESHGAGRVVRRLAVCDFTGGPLRTRRRGEITEILASALASAGFEPVKPPVRAFPKDAFRGDEVAAPRPPAPPIATPPSRRAA
ncbi:MAG TPA: hypothetical protein VHE30_26790 [Polyangiaceae bacterium]|nr:hypothetical protein [Polyangiaceae bacterium]